MSAMPSVGSMRRSRSARSKRVRVHGGQRGLSASRVAVTSKPIAVSRISSTSTIASVVVDDQDLALHRPASLQSEVDLLETFEVGPQTVGLGLPRGQLLAGAHQVALAAGEIARAAGRSSVSRSCITSARSRVSSLRAISIGASVSRLSSARGAAAASG